MSPQDATLPDAEQSSPSSLPIPFPNQAVATKTPSLPIIEGEHRQLDLAPVREEPPLNIQQVSRVTYTAIGGIILLIAAAAIVISLAWFVGDLHAILTSPIPASVTDHTTYTRDAIINAAVNLLANLVLVLVLLEILSAIVNFVRLRRATARPIVLVPLYIVMRAIVLLGGQLFLNPPTASTGTTTFLLILGEMGAVALVGLMLSAALAALREPMPKEEKKQA
jgi:uncharacterized membrane protein (DUF373 family)